MPGANGAAMMKRIVALGMLIAAPVRGSAKRRPTRPVTRARPKHAALRNAKMIANAGFRFLPRPPDHRAAAAGHDLIPGLSEPQQNLTRRHMGAHQVEREFPLSP